MKPITRNFQVGQLLVGPPKTVTLERMRGFSGWPNKNIHTDDDSAKACGLPAPIASATMYQAYLVDWMLELFGGAWITHGELELAFIKMVLAGDVLTWKANVLSTEPEAGGTKLRLEVRCENQRDESVAVGTACGRLGT